MRFAIRLGLFAFLCAAFAFAGNAAWPQASRTIKIVISVPPGGTIDLLVRVMADYLGRTRGLTIIVESRPGAGSIIAAETVARAAPDGNTLLINSNGQMISPVLRKVNFDPRTSFEPICFLVDSPQVLVVNSKSPYRTLAEFVEAARAKPGELSISTVGPNTTQHIAVERFKRVAGIDLTYVPFTGGAPAINALLGGHVTAVLQNFSEAGEQVTVRRAARARDPGAGADPAAARGADHRRSPATRISSPTSGSGWWRRRRRRADHRAIHRMVRQRDRGARGQGQARRPRALSQSALRRRLRRAYPASGRRVHARDRGAEAQGLEHVS